MSEAFLARRTMSRVLSVIIQTSVLPCVTSQRGQVKEARGHQKAQDQLKCNLTSDELIAYFDPHMKTILFVDVSLLGFGAVLTHSVWSPMPVKLSPVLRYSQIEREASAIT